MVSFSGEEKIGSKRCQSSDKEHGLLGQRHWVGVVVSVLTGRGTSGMSHNFSEPQFPQPYAGTTITF